MCCEQAGAGLADAESVSDLSGRVINLPTRDQIEIPQFNEALIVEYYSR